MGNSIWDTWYGIGLRNTSGRSTEGFQVDCRAYRNKRIRSIYLYLQQTVALSTSKITQNTFDLSHLTMYTKCDRPNGYVAGPRNPVELIVSGRQ